MTAMPRTLRAIRGAIAAALAAGWVMSAPAQIASGAVDTQAAAGSELTEGEVRKVDAGNGKLTLRHGPLVNLDMPGMTMVFQVRDPAMLQGLQPGDKVRFAAEKIDGRFTVVRLEPSP